MRQYVEGRFEKIQRPQNSPIVVLLKRQVASTYTTTSHPVANLSKSWHSIVLFSIKKLVRKPTNFYIWPKSGFFLRVGTEKKLDEFKVRIF